MTTRCSRSIVVALVAAASLLSLACQNKAKPTNVPETPSAPAESAPSTPPSSVVQPSAEPFQPTSVDKSTVVEASIDQLNRDGVLRTIYFGYNSNDLDDAAKTTLQANAAWLKSNPKHTVQVGGHCDERGSIGYNVALGDRRAAAVKDYLIGLGVNASSLVAVSFGEEQPVDPGHNDAAWSQNRRAQFTITQ